MTQYITQDSYRDLLSNVIDSKDEQLLQDYIKAFFAYVHFDYLTMLTPEDFRQFAISSYKFAKQYSRKDSEYKIAIEKSSDKPMITVHILNLNKPFIIDSIKCLLANSNLTCDFLQHPVIHPIRDASGNMTAVNGGETSESVVLINILGRFDDQSINTLQQDLLNTLSNVTATHTAWHNIPSILDQEIEQLNHCQNDKIENIQESQQFLSWIKEHYFTFLGSVKIDCINHKVMQVDGDEKIWGGVTKDLIEAVIEDINQNPSSVLAFGKIDVLSTVYKNDFIDLITVKHYENNKIVSARVFLGLYSYAMDFQSVKSVPIARRKLEYVIDRAKFSPNGYNMKNLTIVMESLPRAMLLSIMKDELQAMVMSILSAMSINSVKVFTMPHLSDRFLDLMIFLPKSRITPENHDRIHKYLAQKVQTSIIKDAIKEVGHIFSFLYVTFTAEECTLSKEMCDEIAVEIDHITSSWQHSLQKSCQKIYDIDKAHKLFTQYNNLFNADYQYKYGSDFAAIDMDLIDRAINNNQMVFDLSSCDGDDSVQAILKVVHPSQRQSLSNTLPILENLGFSVIEESSFNFKTGQSNIWLCYYSLSVLRGEQNIGQIKENTELALQALFSKNAESHPLMNLVTSCNIHWRSVMMLTALTYYMTQIGFIYDNKAVSSTLIKHYDFAKKMVDLFYAKFGINGNNNYDEKELDSYLSSVTSSVDDKILRTLLGIMRAIVRTNFFKYEEPREYISFKFLSSNVPDLPLPRPYAEIYVYANMFEGIHLRGGMVARGGLRWSDRFSDYRTEVLGLMKAQMTKNTIIVPTGSKGGFVVKVQTNKYTANEYNKLAVQCYQNFLRGLLDVTDNVINGQVTHPENVKIHDKQDPYLVVAADKGTASFSDYANAISEEYNFWLGDAFASGGSSGYDHKKLAITARGGWLSVMRAFAEMNRPMLDNANTFTVVGIGGMAGDVFGNGMLLSNKMQLIAAFNHIEIFIDPNPNAATSFEERKRLFTLPNSQWSDYNRELISKGGGVYSRDMKMIEISNEAKPALGLNIAENTLTPDDLIRAILSSPVDLIWNGGIGTYIKSSREEHYAIGDKSNDKLRINGKDVRAKIVGEGGNLGVSQLGRIEYAANGGVINTDFIDNSAGVDCSDHEVNIKIALRSAMSKNLLTLNERNILLTKMQDDVSNLVLKDNRRQGLSLTILERLTVFTVENFIKAIENLESSGLLDRKVEFVLSNDALLKRYEDTGVKLTRPELAVLLSYTKMYVAKELRKSHTAQDTYFDTILLEYFPQSLQHKFKDELLQHQLRSEIIITEITNMMVDYMSFPVIMMIQDECNASIADIAKAFFIVNEVLSIETKHSKKTLIDIIKTIDLEYSHVDMSVRLAAFTECNKAFRRATVWVLKHLDVHKYDIHSIIIAYQNEVRELVSSIDQLVIGKLKESFQNSMSMYLEANISEEIALHISRLDSSICAYDIAMISQNVTKCGNDANKHDMAIATIYFTMGDELGIDRLRKVCDKVIASVSHYEKIATRSIKDDLYHCQRLVTEKLASQSICINKDNSVVSNPKASVMNWIKLREHDWLNLIAFITDIEKMTSPNVSMLILANKKLSSLISS